MKRNKKTRVRSLLTSLLLLQTAFIFAQFPYFNSAQKGDDFVLLGESQPGLVRYNMYGLELLHAQNQFAGVYLKNHVISTAKGFILEFEYAMDGGRMENNKYGDGLAMVLFDATETNPQLGFKGGALGYAHTKNKSEEPLAGLTKGIFGLGLDVYGNYKRIMREDKEIRNGITANADGNFVVLRGPYSDISRFEGYPVLFAIGTTRNANFYLNKDTGEIINRQRGFVGRRFNLRGAILQAKPGAQGYRKVRIAFIAGKEDATGQEGFYIFVTIVNGGYTSSIVRNYFVPNKGKIKYVEQMSQGIESVVRTINMNVPSALKLGFTGSTGAAFVRIHIRNIALSLPFAPEVNDMTIPDLIHNRSHTLFPLYSAWGYDSNEYSILNPPNNSISYLDLTSFRFKLFDSRTKEYTVNNDPHHLTVSGVGSFVYNTTTGAVVFTPVEGYSGKSYTFYYDIKNKRPATGVDISTEEYRSRTAAVILNFSSTIPLYRNPPLIINKGVNKPK